MALATRVFNPVLRNLRRTSQAQPTGWKAREFPMSAPGAMIPKAWHEFFDLDSGISMAKGALAYEQLS